MNALTSDDKGAASRPHNNAPSLYIYVLGCRLNEAEAANWSRSARNAGLGLARRPEDATLVILNTCAVTQEATKKSRKIARKLRKNNPEAKLVLTGCYATLDPQGAATTAHVDLVVSNANKDDLISQVRKSWPELFAQRKTPETEDFTRRRTREFIKVQDGCRNRCSFCIVTVARGEERSLPIRDVVAEIHSFEAMGVRDITLTGVHLGGYGSDIENSLEDLVSAVLARTTIDRIRLSSLEPWDLPESIWRLWRNPRLCPHLHLPLQSGSDPILRRMSRRCDLASFTAIADQARRRIPDLILTTDIIVGFPGESEEDFSRTLAACRKLRFSHIHVFPYSARQGSAAARFGETVSPETISRRSQELRTLAEEMRDEILQPYIGSTQSVLWEARGKAHDNSSTRWSGLTRNYLRVQVDIPNSRHRMTREPQENEITDLTIGAVENGMLRGLPH